MNFNQELVVVKYGSSSVSNPETGMDTERLGLYSERVARLMTEFNVIMVSSGSINSGKAMWGQEKPLASDQDYAAIGSGVAFTSWQEALRQHDVHVAQIPVTNHEIDSAEGQVLEERLCNLSAQGILPIANGNDALSVEGAQEYAIDTDNDRLAGHMAEMMIAQHLLLLTDRDGLMDGDELVQEVDINDRREYRSALSLTPIVSAPGGGRGGMRSKLETARRFVYETSGDAYIAGAHADIHDVFAGKTGTHIFARD